MWFTMRVVRTTLMGSQSAFLVIPAYLAKYLHSTGISHIICAYVTRALANQREASRQQPLICQLQNFLRSVACVYISTTIFGLLYRLAINIIT